MLTKSGEDFLFPIIGVENYKSQGIRESTRKDIDSVTAKMSGRLIAPWVL